MALKGLGRGTHGARHRHGLEILRVVSTAPPPTPTASGQLAILLETGESLLLETGWNLQLEERIAVGYFVLLENGEALNFETDKSIRLEL